VSLSEEQIERYSRHIILSEVGGIGQEKLLAGKVLIVGAGGLGSPVGLYLAAAGIGTIGVIDADVVDLTNLQRQVLHSTADLGKPKVESAKDAMSAINTDIHINTYHHRLTAENALEILKDYDFVIDGTDNFPSKFLVADACHFAGKPYSHAGILRFDGQLMTVIPGETACYRCVFNAPPAAGAVPSCSQAGVIGVLPGVVGSLQATEAIKLILGVGDLLTDCILVYDALKASFRKVTVKRNNDCPLCGEHPTINTLRDEEQAQQCDLKPNGN
jgi:molybdopterin/thiamine biosynthesis adenylyltransferase